MIHGHRRHHREAPASAPKSSVIFRANVPAVHAEKGCIEYGAALDADPRAAVPEEMGRRHVPRDREVGKHGCAEGARRGGRTWPPTARRRGS